MANMYDPYVYKPTNKEQLGLGLGTLISAALAASRGRNTGDALIRAAAGGLAGYGEGYKNMLDQYNDVFRRAIESKQLQNQEENMAIRNALAQENLGLRKEMFEAGKPLRDARIERLLTPKPIDYNKIRDERTKRRLDIKLKRQKLAGGEKTTQQLLEEALKEENVDITLDRFLNEARKVNPGVSDDELTRYYNKKYGQ